MNDWYYQMIFVLPIVAQQDDYNCGVYVAAYVTQLLFNDARKILGIEEYFDDKFIDNTPRLAWNFRTFMCGVILDYISKM